MEGLFRLHCTSRPCFRKKRIISLLRCSSPVDRVDLLLTRSKPSRDEFHCVLVEPGHRGPPAAPTQPACFSSSARPGSPWAARHGVPCTYNGSSRRGRRTQEPNPTGPSISNCLVPVFPAPDEYRDPLLRTQAGPWPTRTVVHVWVSRGDSLPSSMHVHSMFEPTCARFRLSCLVQRAARVVWSNHPGRDSTHHRPVRRWARFNSRSLYGACTDGQGGKAEARAFPVLYPHVPSQLNNSRWSQTHRETETQREKGPGCCECFWRMFDY